MHLYHGLVPDTRVGSTFGHEFIGEVVEVGAVLLTDVVPTGYQAAEMAGIQPGDTVVVFGAGPIGIMAAKCS
ncbi:MAG: hypothetical protein ACN6O7_02690 [Sphingobacterium sp.]